MNARRTKREGNDLESLEAMLGFRFRDRSLLERALVHSSAATEGDLESNQTMEFLGDAVLDLAVSDLLLRYHPNRAEGELTRMRASIVSAKGLGVAAGRLGLGRWIRLGRGEARSGGGTKANILADTYEAVVAAVFLDGGYDAARLLVEQTFGDDIAAADPVGGDWKTELQELTQSRYHGTPSYALISSTGPDHAKHFVVAIRIAGEVIARGEGSNRKSAEQMAAQEAVRILLDRPVEADVAEAAPPAAVQEEGKKAAAKPRARRKPAVASDPGADAIPDAAPGPGHRKKA
ncbi:MAG: ribonuclease III [Candidatus Binatia bacterium]